MRKLSVVILNHNTKKLLLDCLLSLEKVKKEVDFEVIVVDNASTDGSVEEVSSIKYQVLNLKIIKNEANLGFARGNNRARNEVSGKYVLFLNTDTVVYKNTLKETVEYLDSHQDVGAVTCKLVLPNGRLDRDTRRSFITPWVGLVHLFLRLDRIFPHSKIFSRYWYGYLNENTVHEVDAIQGAYFMVKKKTLDDVGWFDEDYYLDGEDIDLSWRIREKGWKVIYYPKVKTLHLKGATKGKVESETKKSIPLRLRIENRLSGVNSMEIFYQKHLWSRYPLLLNFLVVLGIAILKIIRFGRTVLFG